MTDSELITFLYQAHATEFGLKLEVTNIEAFKRRYYKVRKSCIKEGVTEFEELSLKISPTDPLTQVWIVNNAKEIRDTTGEANPELSQG